jgi:hypothetical protein
MIRFLFFVIILLSLNSIDGFSQKIEGKVVSKKTDLGIFNVAVKTDTNIGTTSKENGVFTINLSNANTITFSCLGYQTKIVEIAVLQENNYIVYLQENVNVLDEIKITASAINLDSLLLKTQKNMRLYFVAEDSLQQTFYSYSKQIIKPTKASDVDLKRTNLLDRKQTKLARAELDSLVEKYADKPGTITEEFYVSKEPALLINDKSEKETTSTHIKTIAGFKNNYIDETISVDEMDKIFKNTLLKYLDTTKSYKVKTGLFTIDKDISFQKISEMKDSVENDNNFTASYGLLRYDEAKVETSFFLKEDELNFLSRKYYNHIINEPTYVNNKKFYSVSFYPRKSKSKFFGTILIDYENITISRINYSYAEDKRGDHINLKFLLGVKYSENNKEISIHYKTLPTGRLFVKYFKETKQSYAYISRPLTFTENKGWFEKKDKVKIDFTFEVNFTEGKEVFYETPVILSKNEWKTINKDENKKKFPFLSKEAYEATNWRNKNLIENYLSVEN